MIKNKTTHDFAREKNKLSYSLPRNRSAAMEMSVGTIVTIVLLVTVLVLGLVMVRSIFSSGTNAIGEIDKQIQDQINKLFTEGESDKGLSVYPVSREITMKKGEEGGFGFSIKNLNNEPTQFNYEVYADEISEDCIMTKEQADRLIDLGKKNTRPIELNSGSYLTNAVLVKFVIPESASRCRIRYIVEVKDKQGVYETTSMDLIIK